MILASHGIIGSSIVQFAFDADTQAFFDRVTTAGGSLSTTEQDAVNTLVVQMKADGIWTKMQAIYPMVGASAAACAQNLKSSSFTGSFTITGWTFASTGATPNGTSAFMDTNMSASSSLSISSAHMSSYNNTTPNNGVMLGNGVLSCLLQYDGNFINASLATISFITNAATKAASFIMINRQSSSDIKIIRNSSIITSRNNNIGISYDAANITLGKYGSGFFQSAQFAFASIGEGLTDTESSNLYTAVQAFNTTLSRNV
jgi:hypothetical protein